LLAFSGGFTFSAFDVDLLVIFFLNLRYFAALAGMTTRHYEPIHTRLRGSKLHDTNEQTTDETTFMSGNTGLALAFFCFLLFSRFEIRIRICISILTFYSPRVVFEVAFGGFLLFFFGGRYLRFESLRKGFFPTQND
jgi:hypothetical protein